ncbi:hypothetical protein [uncultured Croceitalea sp.]|uniref:Vgb family protein n=1 Tax=uncultured Croceitalea sp. TaxID=1798908 RepID=UPI003305674C
MMYLLLAFLIFTQSSCSSDSDETVVEPDGQVNPDPDPDPEPENPEVETLIQNFGATDALSIDGNGTIYASNFGGFNGTEVLKVNPESAAVEVAIDNLRAPTGNIVDDAGNTYVVHNVRPTEPGSNKFIGDVLKVDSDGNRTVLATLPGFPSGITLDDLGNVYVSNFLFGGVHQISADGQITLYVGDERLLGGVGIDFDDDGNLFVGNFETGDILKISADRSIEVLVKIPTVRQDVVIGYLTYYDGSIYATATGEHVIYKVSMSGEATVFAGSGTQKTEDGALLEASFDTPNGITADPNKKVLYITQNEALTVISLD